MDMKEKKPVHQGPEKNPMKPFIYYYLIVLIVLMVINALGFSSLFRTEVREVPYNELIRQVVGDQAVELRFLLPSVDANRYPYQEEAEYIQALLENIGLKEVFVLSPIWGFPRSLYSP